MSDEHNTAPPRSRGRKFRIALAALGILSVAFVGFLFRPGRDVSDSVQLRLEKVVTNDEAEVYALFLLTNIGPHDCWFYRLGSQEKRDGEWSAFAVAGPSGVYMTNGESRLVPVKIPSNGSKWRARLLVDIEPTRVQYIRINLLAQLNKILPGAGRSDEDSYRSMLRTNYSAEFPH